MSANALTVAVLVALTVAAAALRIATGPIVELNDGDSLYALAKSGPAFGPVASDVQLAISDAHPGH